MPIKFAILQGTQSAEWNLILRFAPLHSLYRGRIHTCRVVIAITLLMVRHGWRGLAIHRGYRHIRIGVLGSRGRINLLEYEGVRRPSCLDLIAQAIKLLSMITGEVVVTNRALVGFRWYPRTRYTLRVSLRSCLILLSGGCVVLNSC